MSIPSKLTYLSPVIEKLKREGFPNSPFVNIVCHGHSVPAGYFANPLVDTFNAYPHQLLAGLKARFPFALVNVIVTAIGAENSVGGNARFENEVLAHHPDVITIDYALNDRHIPQENARSAWIKMIEGALQKDVKVLLMTPTSDITQYSGKLETEGIPLQQHAQQVRDLADEYSVGLVDSLKAFEEYTAHGGDLSDLLSYFNHPNQLGHELVMRQMMRWFPVA